CSEGFARHDLRRAALRVAQKAEGQGRARRRSHNALLDPSRDSVRARLQAREGGLWAAPVAVLSGFVHNHLQAIHRRTVYTPQSLRRAPHRATRRPSESRPSASTGAARGTCKAESPTSSTSSWSRPPRAPPLPEAVSRYRSRAALRSTTHRSVERGT